MMENGTEVAGRVAVIGLGNVLVGDDAFGPYVTALLQARFITPDDVVIEDVGTPGLDLGPHLAGARAVIVVDTVKGEGPPGTLRLYRRAELFARPPLPRTNPHQPGLVETLLLLDLLEFAPRDVLLIGAVPERYDTGAPLTAALRATAEGAITAVRNELARIGAPLVERAEPLDPVIWWELPRNVPVSSTCD